MLLADIVNEHVIPIELARLPHGWMALFGVIALAALCYLVVWMYRREGRVGSGLRVRILLACLRCLVILLLALVWLQPVSATYVVRTISGRVAVLVDRSASMSIVDADVAPATLPPGGPEEPPEGRPTRLRQVAHLLLKNEYDWLRRLDAENELDVFAFGENTVRLARTWKANEDADAADAGIEQRTATTSPAAAPRLETVLVDDPVFENRTDIGQAIESVRSEVGNSPVAGIVLLSDGGLNQGLSADDIAAYARRHKAPIYAVGVGSLDEPPNVRITNVAAPATTPKGDPFEIRVDLSITGVAFATINLSLTAQRMDEGAVADGPAGGSGAADERVVETRKFVLGEDDPSATAVFEVEPQAAGEFIYRARVAKLPVEPVEFDNVREVPVLVLDERIRVLIVSGRPSYDYRYVSRLLERDKTVELSCWLQSADQAAVRDGNTLILELPRKPEEVFDYDALLLLDPNPRNLDASWAVTVRRLIDEFGGGVLLQAGPHFTTRFLNDARLRDLVAVFPVSPDPDADVRLSEFGAYRTRAYAMHTPRDAQGHPLLTLHSDPVTNRSVWSALPGVWWYLPVLREKPLATVLLRHGRGVSAAGTRVVVNPVRPGGAGRRNDAPILMAVQPVGTGRTVFLGIDGTWRWRAGSEYYFNRFWVQMVRYLAQTRRQGVSKRGAITIDRESINVGDYFKIEVRVLDESFVPWHESTIEALLELTDGATRSVTLNAIPGREGWFAGRVSLTRPGSVVIRVPLPRSPGAASSQPAASALVKRIRIHRPDVEMRGLRLREDVLSRLASESGGRYVPLAGAGELPEWIRKHDERKPPVRGNVVERLDETWMLALLALLLAVEWTVRRRNHLL